MLIGGELPRPPLKRLAAATNPKAGFSSPLDARGFGLGWFMHHATDNALQFDIVESRGASGHMVTVLPNKQAVLVRIGSLGNDAGIPERFHALLRQL